MIPTAASDHPAEPEHNFSDSLSMLIYSSNYNAV
jgi:hypothetical protein